MGYYTDNAATCAKQAVLLNTPNIMKRLLKLTTAIKMSEMISYQIMEAVPYIEVLVMAHHYCGRCHELKRKVEER